jgi:hypothetical protein
VITPAAAAVIIELPSQGDGCRKVSVTATATARHINQDVWHKGVTGSSSIRTRVGWVLFEKPPGVGQYTMRREATRQSKQSASKALARLKLGTLTATTQVHRQQRRNALDLRHHRPNADSHHTEAKRHRRRSPSLHTVRSLPRHLNACTRA